MCGITGTVGHSVEQVERALELMVNRGPDSGGIWQSAGTIFGHRRLSIIDLSQDGHQPMTDNTGQVAITFNGEIYNFQSLRLELENYYSFRSRSDTEVILAGYLCWGIETLLNKIRGMFSFAIWDARYRTCYLARDPFGKKPLYYWQHGGKLAFASTLQALLCYFDKTPDINPIAVDDYLTYLAVPGDISIYQGVSKLLPGHFAEYKEGQLSVRRYWFLSFSKQQKMTEQEALEQLDHLVRKAVRSRLISDVPIGCFLSGGVDSSLIASIMAQETGSPIATITMGFEDPKYDERPYARIVSQKYNTEYHEFVLQADLWKHIPEILGHFGEPFADSSALPTYFVAKRAKEQVTVILNGDGGDELFAGYTRPLAEALAIPYRRMVPGIMRTLIGKYVQSKDKLKPRMLNGIKQVLESGMHDPRQSFVFNRALRSYRNRLYTQSFMNQLGAHHPDEWYWKIWDQADGLNSVDKVLYGDAITYLPDELLPKMDLMTMAHSLEARSPLLDIDLAQYAATIPYDLKIQGLDTKVLLKKLASRYVPHEVLYRPKKGFNMPMETWLKTVLYEPLQAILLSREAQDRGLFSTGEVRVMIEAHVSGKKHYTQQLWSLLCLELWFRKHDRTEPDWEKYCRPTVGMLS